MSKKSGSRHLAGKSKPTLLYLVCGLIAAAFVAFSFFPCIKAGDKTWNVITFAMDGYIIGESVSNVGAWDFGGTVKNVAMAMAGAYSMLVALNVAWALFSFLRKRPAGVFGIIASLLSAAVSAFWLFVAITIAKNVPGIDVTYIPIINTALMVIGIPLSIVQIARKKYL